MGKTSFPHGIIHGFPRMHSIRVGGFQPPGQKHKVIKQGCPIQATAGIKLSQRAKCYPQERVQGDHLPGAGRTADDRLWTKP